MQRTPLVSRVNNDANMEMQSAQAWWAPRHAAVPTLIPLVTGAAVPRSRVHEPATNQLEI